MYEGVNIPRVIEHIESHVPKSVRRVIGKGEVCVPDSGVAAIEWALMSRSERSIELDRVGFPLPSHTLEGLDQVVSPIQLLNKVLSGQTPRSEMIGKHEYSYLKEVRHRLAEVQLGTQANRQAKGHAVQSLLSEEEFLRLYKKVVAGDKKADKMYHALLRYRAQAFRVELLTPVFWEIERKAKGPMRPDTVLALMHEPVLGGAVRSIIERGKSSLLARMAGVSLVTAAVAVAIGMTWGSDSHYKRAA